MQSKEQILQIKNEKHFIQNSEKVYLDSINILICECHFTFSRKFSILNNA